MPSFYPQSMPGPPFLVPDFQPAYGSSNGRSSKQMQSQPDQYCNTQFPSRQFAPQFNALPQQRPTYTLPAPCLGGQMSSGYINMNASMLPPLRPRNDSVMGFETVQRLGQGELDRQALNAIPQQEQPVEEQPVGGISAKLDYDLERMTDFVAGAATGMYAFHLSQICMADIDLCRSIQGGTQVQPAFRKWVLQVLTATRLPSATILLSLHYMAARLRDHSSSVGSSDQHVYRLLAVAMTLGSKFLDDNTFINRSWSDVSGIKVSELNALEIEWLGLIAFDLHADMADPNGVSLWIQAWRDYDAQMERKAQLFMLNQDYGHSPPQYAQPHAFKYQTPSTVIAHGYITPASSNPSPTFSNMSADPWNTFKAAKGYDDRSYPSTRQTSAVSSQVATPEQERHAPHYRQILPPPQRFNTQAFYTPWAQNIPQTTLQPYDTFNTSYQQRHTPYIAGQSYAPQPVVG